MAGMTIIAKFAIKGIILALQGLIGSYIPVTRAKRIIELIKLLQIIQYGVSPGFIIVRILKEIVLLLGQFTGLGAVVYVI